MFGRINVKLGGTNFRPLSHAMKWLRDVPTMVLGMIYCYNCSQSTQIITGADVSHPAPGSMQPSIAALVSSHDSTACQYTASIRVQPPRTEMIEDLTNMVLVSGDDILCSNVSDHLTVGPPIDGVPHFQTEEYSFTTTTDFLSRRCFGGRI